jgi:hypothetical protein
MTIRVLSVRERQEIMIEQSGPGISCEYLQGGLSCSNVVNGEGHDVRMDKCSNSMKTVCCYLCGQQKDCPVSCDYLEGTAQATTHSTISSSNDGKSPFSPTVRRIGNTAYAFGLSFLMFFLQELVTIHLGTR